MGSGLIVAGTGHRPEDAEDEAAVRIKSRVKLEYAKKPIDTFITGMAAGFDLWAADEAIKLGLDITAAVPWRGHKPRKADEELYAHILASAKSVVYVVDQDNYPGGWVYQKRNEWMVDHADLIMAYWNPNKPFGGTYNCYQYAKDQDKPIANIWYDPPF